jgi:metallo-beta-lactamase family protein
MSDAKLKICFHGGVDSVTGANFVLHDQENNFRIMIDCGLAQGLSKNEKDPNYEDFKYNPRDIDFLIVTHAHIDHIGRIPKLVHDGFAGSIISTKPTQEIVPLMFEDAVNIIGDNARKKDIAPLYTKEDIERTLSMWQSIDYHQFFNLNDRFDILFKDAGHILGSGIVYIKDKKLKKNYVFTGDLGNSPTPLIRNTEKIDDADYLVMESVYGDRNHEDKIERKEKLAEIINKIIERKGTLLIPVFSLEKTQVLLHEMNDLIEGRIIKSVPVFFDSPLGIKLTDVYASQFKNFNEKVQARILSGDDIFDFPKLIKTMDKADSQAIHKTLGPKIIIASSGMSVGGRILDHERHYLPDPKNAILFIGYQVAGSLGRMIQQGEKHIMIDGKKVPVSAEILTVSGYSSHMDSDNLVDFVANTADRVKKVFVVMGESKASLFLVQKLRDNLGVDAIHPEVGECFEV